MIGANPQDETSAEAHSAIKLKEGSSDLARTLRIVLLRNPNRDIRRQYQSGACPSRRGKQSLVFFSRADHLSFSHSSILSVLLRYYHLLLQGMLPAWALHVKITHQIYPWNPRSLTRRQIHNRAITMSGHPSCPKCSAPVTGGKSCGSCGAVRNV